MFRSFYFMYLQIRTTTNEIKFTSQFEIHLEENLKLAIYYSTYTNLCNKTTDHYHSSYNHFLKLKTLHAHSH